MFSQKNRGQSEETQQGIKKWMNHVVATSVEMPEIYYFSMQDACVLAIR